MKKKMVTALLAVSMLAGLSAVNVMAADDGADTITVGFSQVGAESDCNRDRMGYRSSGSKGCRNSGHHR